MNLRIHWDMPEIDLDGRGVGIDEDEGTTLDLTERLELVLQLRELQEPDDVKVRFYAV